MATKKTYVITGATSGIGYSLVEHLCKNNIVFLGYRNQEKLNDLGLQNCQNIHPFFIDMSNSNSIKSATDYILNNTESIDTIINAAGCVIAGAVEDIDIKDIKYQFEVNTFAQLDFSKRLISALKKGGKIINISSMASYGVFPFVSPYCASKRALDILFNSLQTEFGNDIKIISIKPGVIATPLWSKSIEANKSRLLKNNKSKYEKEYQYLIKNAEDNEKNGINVEKVVKIILKADNAKYPKSSYKIGFDAFLASILSIMPQEIINQILKIGLRLKIK